MPVQIGWFSRKQFGKNCSYDIYKTNSGLDVQVTEVTEFGGCPSYEDAEFIGYVTSFVESVNRIRKGWYSEKQKEMAGGTVVYSDLDGNEIEVTEVTNLTYERPSGLWDDYKFVGFVTNFLRSNKPSQSNPYHEDFSPYSVQRFNSLSSYLLSNLS